MCGTCGCGETPRHGHHHPHRDIAEIELDVLAANGRIATANRRWLAERDVLAVNLMSSPGSGKTTLLERTIRALAGSVPVSVVEGDQETELDADRIRATGVRVVQVNTGTGCHLDASMLQRQLPTLDPPPGSVLFVENVGNLVCPALFDLGEHQRAVIMSVTEGADKPAKYPTMFATADVLLLNKIDLLPHVDFDTALFDAAVQQVNPGLPVLRVSATTGEGLARWYSWLEASRTMLTEATSEVTA
jgi:hydrogenase nickel incorporation protein HypB